MIFDELRGQDAGLFHAINGYVFGNLPGLVMKKGEKVRWYVMAMGNEKDLHTPHWHGLTVSDPLRHMDVVELLPGHYSLGGYGGRQSRSMDVPLSRGRPHGSGHDEHLYHLRAAGPFVPA